MKTGKFILFSVITVLFYSSCTVSHVNENLIIGKWSHGRVTSFIVNKNLAGDTSYNASNKLRLGLDTANVALNERTSLREFKTGLKAYAPVKTDDAMNNMEAEMTFGQDKNASILFKHGTAGGTWKMNGKGNRVTVKDTVSKKKITINISSIDLRKLVIYKRYAIGDLMVTFSR